MRIALGQLDMVWENADASIDRAETLIKQAAEAAAECIIFPEIFQIAAREADVLLVIANWPQIRREHWQTLLRARAIETQSYVVGVNCVGMHDGCAYSGDSMAVDSIGNILGMLSGREGILVCDLDDRAWSLRHKFSTRADRREDLYRTYFALDN